MPSKFDFISPDILLREVDMSELPPDPTDDGILIIGQAKKGPAMKPIRLKNTSDLKEISPSSKFCIICKVPTKFSILEFVPL